MPTPFEIISGALTAWVAPVGETMPDIDTPPAGNWAKLGTNGPRNISEDGVTISHPQSIETIRALGSTGPVKFLRTEEDMIVSFTIWDLTLEQYKHVLNLGTVTSVAAASGTPGYRHLPILRGASPSQRALLLRIASPYGDDPWNMQYEVPIVIHTGEPEVVFKKDEPAGLLCEFTAQEDPNATAANLRFGRIVAQTANAV